MPNTIILSIRPQWAEAILSGRKQWEFRRIPPKAGKGLRVILYATSSRQAIVGEFMLGNVLTKPIDQLVKETINNTPHNPREVYSYFTGRDSGSALQVSYPRRYANALPITDIIRWIPNFKPPQNFFYIRENDPGMKKLLSLLPANKMVHGQIELL